MMEDEALARAALGDAGAARAELAAAEGLARDRKARATEKRLKSVGLRLGAP
jgi:hypothetical protein